MLLGGIQWTRVGRLEKILPHGARSPSGRPINFIEEKKIPASLRTRNQCRDLPKNLNTPLVCRVILPIKPNNTVNG